MLRTTITTLCALVALTIAAHAQYSDDVFALKKSSELYDERGFLSGSSITVDGALAVSNNNGNVGYSYPICHTTVSGFPFDVSLNYCGSVAFSAYKEYKSGNIYDAYGHWERFHQNRPAWILGCCGFAVQMLGCASSMHADPANFIDIGRTQFSDSELVWTCDGYDVCGRAEDIVASSNIATHGYIDVISLLRDDGSLLQLYNKATYDSVVDVERRADLYTGTYFIPEANSHAFAVVTFDTAHWPANARELINEIASDEDTRYIPRVVRYYPGNGMELVFHEWTIPNGMRSYRGAELDVPDRFGAVKAGATIFYLQEINSNAGPLVRAIRRSRHFYPRDASPNANVDAYDSTYGTVADSTVGRALVTNIGTDVGDVHISYGQASMTIEAYGRTTKVRFAKVVGSGSAPATPVWMPLAERGYFTETSGALAALNEQGEESKPLYASYLGYVTSIIDPAGRTTSFDYESYIRRYTNYGFPVPGPVLDEDVVLTARNLRLKSVTEPTATYRISYARGDAAFSGPQYYEDVVRDTTLSPADAAGWDYPYIINNVASVVRKYDRTNTLLTKTEYVFHHAPGEGFDQTDVYFTDTVSGAGSHNYYHYKVDLLPELTHYLPRPRFTELNFTTSDAADAADVTTNRATYFKKMPESDYVWLPIADTVVVNGILKARTNYAYTFDTVRTFGGNDSLAAALGLELKRQTTTTLDPATNRPLLVTTTDFVNIPLVDTTLTRLDTTLDKFATQTNYRNLLDSGAITMPYLWALYDPRVYAYTLDSVVGHTTLPPQYGLVARTVTVDSNGTILGGAVHEYTPANTGSPYLNAMMFRGELMQDSIIGEGGVTIPGMHYQYTDLAGLNLPAMVTDPLGARNNFFYESYSSRALYHDGGFHPVAAITRDDDTKHDTLLPSNGFFSRMYGRPVVSESHVRRYDPASGTLTEDTLLNLFQYTYYGLAKATADPNGNWSATDYDADGRLKILWAPGDFPAHDSTENIGYDAVERTGLTGYNYFTYSIDTVYCGTGGGVIGPGQSYDGDGTAFAAGHRAAHVPGCPCAHGIREKHPGASPQTTCDVPLPFVNNDYYEGRILYKVDSASALVAADRLDSAYLEVNVTDVVGDCATLMVIALVTGDTSNLLAQSYVFNCGGVGLSLDSSFTLKVSLNAIKSELMAIAPGRTLEFRFTMTTVGAGINFVSGLNAEDAQPTLVLVGHFTRPYDLYDYTLEYRYGDDSLKATAIRKIDDIRHTSTRYDTAAMSGATIRRTQATSTYSADGRILKTTMPVTENGITRTDSLVYAYTGLGQRTRARDQAGDTVAVAYDAVGRPVTTTNGDGTHVSASYSLGTPSSFGVSDQDFHGFCERIVTTNEDGVRFAKYSDAFGRLRREVADTAGLKLTTRYEYDVQGRLRTVVNPKGDTTRYTYDAFGHVKYKSQPDIGTVSYAYDRLGRVRFVQSAEQASTKNNLVGFNEYDDLGRVTLIGEAAFSSWYNEDAFEQHGWERAKKRDGATIQSGEDDPFAERYTNTLDPDTLNTGADTTLYTANKTLWMTPADSIPNFSTDWTITDCEGIPADSVMLGETAAPVGPFLMRPAQFYNSSAGIEASEDDFENIALHPEFPRIAIAYDALPASQGAVWGNFPDTADWNNLAPHDVVRNLKGHEGAVAYRERGCEPFHYTVLSYDERGRVEALLRYTENLGFDAVYYTYNSANQVTSVRAADALRQYATWYGYDAQGRVDSVWTYLTPVTGGLYGGGGAGIRYCGAPLRPDSADIIYSYTKTGQLAGMTYPPVNVLVSYAYNHRKWLDSLVAVQDSANLFREVLSYDPTGQITGQTYRHDTSAAQSQRYGYDSVQRLVNWTQGLANLAPTDSTGYSYDAVGNRGSVTKLGVLTEGYTYQAGANQLMTHVATPAIGNPIVTGSTYNASGALNGRSRWEETALGAYVHGISTENMGYSFRELMRRYQKLDDHDDLVGDWRYRYSAGGEREQKRLYAEQSSDSDALYPWVYYLLGGHKEQLAVYHGRQTADTMCSDTGRRVYVYPVEYITNGIGWNGVPEQIPNLVTKANGTKEFQISDHLASLRVAIEGGTAKHTDYDPWGNQIGTAVTGERSTFNAQERDAESKFLDLSDRNLDAAIGRFTRPDRLWESSPSQSPYGYCANNPLRMTDPTGMQAQPSWWQGARDGAVDAGIAIGKTILNTLLESNTAYRLCKNVHALFHPESQPTLAQIGAKLEQWSADVSGYKGKYAQGRAIASTVLQGTFAIASGWGLSAAMRIGGAIAEAGSAVEATTTVQNTTTLYRAVGPAELTDIQTTGVFRNLGSAEGKYFTTSAEAAASYARQAVRAFGDPPYTLVQTTVPESIFEGLASATVDRGIPAWVIPDNRLVGLVPQVLNTMPKP